MKIIYFFTVLFFTTSFCNGQLSRFETSMGAENASYYEVMEWYKNLDKKSKQIKMITMGQTDANIPLNLVLVASNEKFNPVEWRQKNKVIILINNAIHAGEPDGVDASMMLVRDISNNKILLPENVCLAFIPVYNIGGYLNRGPSSRVNQNGPVEYGFRGNSQNLDLNRDFIKCDSKEAIAFSKIFQYLQPDIFIDNHVSDGADYQHTMTLLTTQYNKLGKELGNWLKNNFEPLLYKEMEKEKWDMVPYVNFENENLDSGMHMFYDPPRYSSGYAALFNTIAFVPETHMLKPYKDRVWSTYSLLKIIMTQASLNANAIKQIRHNAIQTSLDADSFPLSWKANTSTFDTIHFKGYQEAYKTSTVTQGSQLYYNHDQPFEKSIKFFNAYAPENFIKAPAYYVIPAGWHEVISRIAANGVSMQPLKKDTTLLVESYSIEHYNSYKNPYEKHHKNFAVSTSKKTEKIKFLRGDVLIPTHQRAKRYLVETLEPSGDDGFFAWNFFDAILQQKEGYSAYRWEPIAAQLLESNVALKALFEEKKLSDSAFANNPGEQLAFIYKHSPYFEPEFLRYPVYRLMQ